MFLRHPAPPINLAHCSSELWREPRKLQLTAPRLKNLRTREVAGPPSRPQEGAWPVVGLSQALNYRKSGRVSKEEEEGVHGGRLL